jgi:hypothetical protein
MEVSQFHVSDSYEKIIYGTRGILDPVGPKDDLDVVEKRHMFISQLVRTNT